MTDEKVTDKENACGCLVTTLDRCAHLLGQCPDEDCCRECGADNCSSRCSNSRKQTEEGL